MLEAREAPFVSWLRGGSVRLSGRGPLLPECDPVVGAFAVSGGDFGGPGVVRLVGVGPGGLSGEPGFDVGYPPGGLAADGYAPRAVAAAGPLLLLAVLVELLDGSAGEPGGFVGPDVTGRGRLRELGGARHGYSCSGSSSVVEVTRFGVSGGAKRTRRHTPRASTSAWASRMSAVGCFPLARFWTRPGLQPPASARVRTEYGMPRPGCSMIHLNLSGSRRM